MKGGWLRPNSGVQEIETQRKQAKDSTLAVYSDKVTVISDLCSDVSFIVLCLILKVTTNIRTLELTHVLGTVSSRSIVG